MRGRGRARRRGLLVAGALALCGLGSVGTVAASAAPGYRLSFGSTVANPMSAGPLIVKGHRASTAEPMMADQIIKHADGTTTVRAEIGQLIYEEYPGSVSHRHWHYKAFVRYQLRSATDLSLVRPDNKAGFCLSDPDYATDFCGSQKPDALKVEEGIGPGNTDYYNPHLEGQYIDVTDVPPGDYWLLHWVNSAEELCESDYANNAAAVKLTLWPNGYGVPPYYAAKEVVAPFPPLFDDPTLPLYCDQAWTKLPDLIQWAPSELAVTPVGIHGDHDPPGGDSPPSGEGPPPAAPTLSERAARRYVVKAVTRRFHKRPRRLRQACRRLSETSFLCRVRWKHRRYRYRGSVKIFTIDTPKGFEPRANLRVRRTTIRCGPGRRCSRTLTAKNMRL